jgi:hypothetical protein
MTLRHALTLTAALLAATVLAACGGSGDDGPDAEQQITDLVTTGVTTTDPQVLCTKTFTETWVQQVYGGTAKCVTVETGNQKDAKPASAAEVSGIKVDGDGATAFLEIKGGSQDGARGALTLAKDGEDWRIDDLSTELLRSQFEAGAKNDRDLPAALKACIVEKVTGLDDAAFRTLSLGAIGEQAEAQKELEGYVAACAGQQQASSGSGSGSASADDVDSETVSVLRKQFEQGVTESLEEDGVSASAIRCVKRELRQAISDDEIVSLIGKSSKEVPPAIAAATAGALAECKAIK